MFSNNSEIFNNIYSELFLVNIFSKTLQNVPIIWNLLYSIESEDNIMCPANGPGPTFPSASPRARAHPSGSFCDAIDLKSLKATNRRPPAQHNRRARATTWCRAKLATPSEVTFWAVRLAAVVYIYMGRDRSMIILLGLGSPAKAQPDELLGWLLLPARQVNDF